MIQDGQWAVWCKEIDKAQGICAMYSGHPLKVIAVQFPFVFVQSFTGQAIVLDTRFLSIGQCDQTFADRFRAVIDGAKPRNNAV